MKPKYYRDLLDRIVRECEKHIPDYSDEDQVYEVVHGECLRSVGEELALKDTQLLPETFLKTIFAESTCSEKVFDHQYRSNSYRDYLWQCLVAEVAMLLQTKHPDMDTEPFWNTER